MKMIIIIVYFNVLALQELPWTKLYFGCSALSVLSENTCILKYNNYSVERYVTFQWTILYEDR